MEPSGPHPLLRAPPCIKDRFSYRTTCAARISREARRRSRPVLAPSLRISAIRILRPSASNRSPKPAGRSWRATPSSAGLRASADCPEVRISSAPESGWEFHWTIWCGHRSKRQASSARVASPLRAGKAIFALSADDWLRRVLRVSSPARAEQSTDPPVQLPSAISAFRRTTLRHLNGLASREFRSDDCAEEDSPCLNPAMPCG